MRHAATLFYQAAPKLIGKGREFAATLLDVGRAIDYYDRFEHAAMMVTAADLAGFTHAHLGALTAILRQADDDTRLGPYGRMIDPDDRRAVLKAASTPPPRRRSRIIGFAFVAAAALAACLVLVLMPRAPRDPAIEQAMTARDNAVMLAWALASRRRMLAKSS